MDYQKLGQSRMSAKKRGNYFKKPRRSPTLRKGYLELHGFSRAEARGYELHHIVEFNERSRLGKFIDMLGNTILLSPEKHKETYQNRKNKKFYRLSFECDFAETQTFYLEATDWSERIEVSIHKREALVNTNLLTYLKAYNNFLLKKLNYSLELPKT